MTTQSDPNVQSIYCIIFDSNASPTVKQTITPIYGLNIYILKHELYNVQY